MRSSSSCAAKRSNSWLAASRIAGVSGSKLWMIARPGFSPRPARPETCETSWKVRSAARNSGSASAVSAEITPTSRTFGKSSPFAIICVPIKTRTSPRPNRSSASWKCAAVCIVSPSTRSSVSPSIKLGNVRVSSSSTRWVPRPNTVTGLPQSGHFCGSICSARQWWQRTYRRRISPAPST